MSVYQVFDTATNNSQLIATMNAQQEAMRSHERGTVAPGVQVPGMLYNKADYGWGDGAGDAFLWHNGSTLVLCFDPRSPQINAGGTVAMAANLAMGGFKITGLADGVGATDAATVGQVVGLTSGAWDADHDAGGKLLKNLGSPLTQTSDQVAARFEDTMQTAHGLMRYIDAVTVDTVFGSGLTTPQTVGGGKKTDPSSSVFFCPRHVHLLVSGNITPVGGGGAVASLAVTHVDAWRTGANAGAWITLATVSGYAIEVFFKTTASQGIGLRVRDVVSNALYSPAVRSAWCFSGVGMA